MPITCWTMGAVVFSLAGGGAEVDGLAKKVAEAGSYAFTIEERPGTGKPLQGKYQKGRPIFFEAEHLEFFRQGETLVYLQGGQWRRSKTGIESDPLTILGAVAQVRSAKLPHEELAVIAKSLQKVRKTARQDGTAVYKCTLSEDGLHKLVRSEFSSVARNGTATLWTSAQGIPVKYELVIRVQGRRGNAEVDGHLSTTVTLDGLGTTMVKVPAAAKKALQE